VTRLNEQSDELADLYQRMSLIRHAEERIGELAAQGALPGAVHLSVGQEGSAVGVCSQLQARDWITSTHRGHGHFLAKGGDVCQMFAEIAGKAAGVCRGMGGSMHVADLAKGMLGANGIVGGGFAIATGAGLAAQLEGDGRVSACFFGEGAANQGVFMECLNISTLWKLPVIFVCENNGYSEFMKASKITAGAVADRARAFGIPCSVIDGNDVLAVAGAARTAIERCRRGEGPVYLEVITYRIFGHGGGRGAEEAWLGGRTYRSAEEVREWSQPTHDPIERFRKYLISEGLFTDEALRAIDARALLAVDRAASFAVSSADADPELAFTLMNVAPMKSEELT
jgi:acetoin:2,6-dichlorophenolindophenol oxidoreductase subunit alpha